MFTKAKAKRKTRSLKFESFEKRELMSATAVLTGSDLRITGTPQNDNIVVDYNGANKTVRVFHEGRLLNSWHRDRIQTINVQLEAGRDTIEMRSANGGIPGLQPNLKSDQFWSLNKVNINFGTGNQQSQSRERASISNVKIVNFSIDGQRTANGVNVDLKGVNVGTFRAEKLSSNADMISITSLSYVDKFYANFGDGDDHLFIGGASRIDEQASGRSFYTQVNWADVKMGAGKDFVKMESNATILAGTINGGSSTTSSGSQHQDRIEINHRKQVAQFSGFEQVIRPKR